MSVTPEHGGHATEGLWQAFRGRLWGFILQRVQHKADAEDILQEVFLRIHRTRQALRDQEALTGWVFQITRNAIVDHYRRSSRSPASLPEDPEAEWAPRAEDPREQREFAGCLLPMIQDLPETHREALMLTELQGLSQVEAAARVGISVPGMKSRVQRARRQLKDLFLACCQVETGSCGGILDCSARMPGSGTGGCGGAE